MSETTLDFLVILGRCVFVLALLLQILPLLIWAERKGAAYMQDRIGPNRASIAVQFVVNYEEGGENCVLHGDAASEAFLSEIVGAQPIDGQRHMNMESLYEYGSRAGAWRLLEPAPGVPGAYAGGTQSCAFARRRRDARGR